MKTYHVFFLIILFTLTAFYIALPEQIPLVFSKGPISFDKQLTKPTSFSFAGKTFALPVFDLKQGLDIQGGMQVVLQADMSEIAIEDRKSAIESAREVILRRVDLFGVSEPIVQTAQIGEDNYRLIVELAGITQPEQALELIGTTAQLDFRLMTASPSAEATASAIAFLDSFQSTDLGGKQLKRSVVQFDPQTGQPVVGLEFDQQGSEMFGQITTQNTGQVLAIFLDEYPLMLPTIQQPILDGQAVITGDFSLEEAKNLSIQLNAGALPVPISVLEQRNIGASLGQTSVAKSIKAGLIGIGLVMLFMIMYYGLKGLIASIALIIYSILTVAIYKILGVTLTLPGIAGLLLSIGMAVDANILIFERMKEELRDGQSFSRAMELGFGRAWDSIKDANLATITTALVLINPLNFRFLNSSGLVKGFGITLLIGVLISLFTGVVVTRTLMRLFLKGPKNA